MSTTSSVEYVIKIKPHEGLDATQLQVLAIRASQLKHVAQVELVTVVTPTGAPSVD